MFQNPDTNDVDKNPNLNHELPSLCKSRDGTSRSITPDVALCLNASLELVPNAAPIKHESILHVSLVQSVAHLFR